MRISRERTASIRSAIRKGAIWLGGALLTVVGFGVIGELFIKYAEQQGLYSDPKRTLEAALSWLWWLAFNPVSLVLYGFGAGVWLDALLRREPGAVDDAGQPIDREALASEAESIAAKLRATHSDTVG